MHRAGHVFESRSRFLVVVLVHMLETFFCKTFLQRDVKNLDFCFPVPVLVFLPKKMGFLRFLLRDSQFLIMQHLLPPVVSSTLIALSFLLDSLITPVFVFPFLPSEYSSVACLAPRL